MWHERQARDDPGCRWSRRRVHRDGLERLQRQQAGERGFAGARAAGREGAGLSGGSGGVAAALRSGASRRRARARSRRRLLYLARLADRGSRAGGRLRYPRRQFARRCRFGAIASAHPARMAPVRPHRGALPRRAAAGPCRRDRQAADGFCRPRAAGRLGRRHGRDRQSRGGRDRGTPSARPRQSPAVRRSSRTRR